MKKSLTMIGVSLLIGVAALATLASSGSDEPDPSARQSPSRMTQEIRAVLQAEQGTLAELQNRLAAAPDEHAYLLVVREIEQQKLATEIRILEIQAYHAQQQGRLDEVKAIEAALDALRSLAAGRTGSSSPPAPASPPAQN
jgi:hypothetical protein